MSAFASTARQIKELDDFCRKSAAPVGETEDARCERAERMIRAAIQGYTRFPAGVPGGISIFAQGSYRNGTNITTDSDVDVAVCCTTSFFTDYTQTGGLGDSYFRNVDAAYTFTQFRADVTQAVQAAFGHDCVTVGNKSLRIAANSGRVGADVVPVFELRQYQANGQYQKGTRFLSRDGKTITNWPHHHYHFGTQKNNATSYRYKKTVRILKTLRRQMVGNASNTPSFLIESLVWNAPDQLFENRTVLGDASLLEISGRVLHWLWSALNNPAFAATMREANMLKLLFSPEQAWTIADAASFVHQAGQKLKHWP